ncbi:MAG TPA: LysE family translocator [Burkholderiaceae bacterium]
MFAAFLIASVVLAVTPGPGVVYIVARTLAQGRGAGLASVAGVALGNLGNALSASLGLAALFALSVAAFEIVKWAGAAYLLWLAFQALRWPVAPGHAASSPPAGVAPAAAPLADVFRDGFVVALLNPKTALFFAAFLPQFIADPAGAGIAQTALLGLVFVTVAAFSDSAYVLLASVLGRAFGTGGAATRTRARVATAGRYATAATFAGLALYTLTASRSR